MDVYLLSGRGGRGTGLFRIEELRIVEDVFLGANEVPQKILRFSRDNPP